MIRKSKIYSRPKKLFDKKRILEENEIKETYGLKCKREIWKADARVSEIRQRAKKLISSDLKEQEAFFEKLKKVGLNVNSIPDVLALTKEDFLKRRLQTILVDKKHVTTTKQARQLITHKKVLVNDEVVSIPSYIVPVHLENKIKLKVHVMKKTAKKSMEIAPEGEEE